MNYNFSSDITIHQSCYCRVNDGDTASSLSVFPGPNLSHMLIIATFHSFLSEFISIQFELAINSDLWSYKVVVKTIDKVGSSPARTQS